MPRIVDDVMATSERDEDEQWLNAVAGHPEPETDQSVNLEAAAVRKVLLRRKYVLDQKLPPLSPTALDEVFERLHDIEREKKHVESPNPRFISGFLAWIIGSNKGNSNGAMSWSQSRVIALAACLVLAIVVVLQSGVHTNVAEEETLATRGGRSEIVQIVEDPEVSAEALTKELTAQGIEVTVSIDDKASNGKDKIVMQIRNSKEAVEFLEDKGFSPDINQKTFIIVLKKLNSSKK
jgi:hypothetical protein